jgi:hypothetical protein
VSILKENEFRTFLKKRKLSPEETDYSVKTVREFEEFLQKKSVHIESARLNDLKDYIELLIKNRKNSMNTLIAIARYLSFAKKNDCLLYLIPLLNTIEILPRVGQRLSALAEEKTRRLVFEGLKLPSLGASQESYPPLTKVILDRMEAELPSKTCKEVLTWNYHGIPAAAFEEQRFFEKASSIDEYLKAQHKTLVEEMHECMKEGRLWYEQEITPRVLKFVKDNQEICTGVRHGDKIYLTKIPFAPEQYLKEKNTILKRYYACHCPLVRASIRDEKPRVSPVFCYCSGGFEKLVFDVIFEEPVEIELLESVLKGDTRCRFMMRIPEVKNASKKIEAQANEPSAC